MKEDTRFIDCSFVQCVELLVHFIQGHSARVRVHNTIKNPARKDQKKRNHEIYQRQVETQWLNLGTSPQRQDLRNANLNSPLLSIKKSTTHTPQHPLDSHPPQPSSWPVTTTVSLSAPNPTQAPALLTLHPHHSPSHGPRARQIQQYVRPSPPSPQYPLKLPHPSNPPIAFAPLATLASDR